MAFLSNAMARLAPQTFPQGTGGMPSIGGGFLGRLQQAAAAQQAQQQPGAVRGGQVLQGMPGGGLRPAMPQVPPQLGGGLGGGMGGGLRPPLPGGTPMLQAPPGIGQMMPGPGGGGGAPTGDAPPPPPPPMTQLGGAPMPPMPYEPPGTGGVPPLAGGALAGLLGKLQGGGAGGFQLPNRGVTGVGQFLGGGGGPMMGNIAQALKGIPGAPMGGAVGAPPPAPPPGPPVPQPTLGRI